MSTMNFLRSHVCNFRNQKGIKVEIKMLSGHKKYKHTFTNVRAHLSHVVMIIRDLLVILIEKVTFLTL